MAPPPHREKDAKVEGRDPLDKTPKKTMAPFRSLMGRLLKVKLEEVAEQQQLYEQAQCLKDTPKTKRKKLSIFEKADEVPHTSTPPRR